MFSLSWLTTLAEDTSGQRQPSNSQERIWLHLASCEVIHSETLAVFAVSHGASLRIVFAVVERRKRCRGLAMVSAMCARDRWTLWKSGRFYTTPDMASKLSSTRFELSHEVQKIVFGAEPLAISFRLDSLRGSYWAVNF
ncbi:hypothetical protein CKAH01_09745 [Colletotrichum kahawae]|uniref:Uncharacterized protein n=1 Tax=Colletotrichum kahawae TaxID=34407 RepID=A0AAD9XZE4_COLKA|nr:hypothetical protein CKAH01_09745 [Colletotrichum kahawae]